MGTVHDAYEWIDDDEAAEAWDAYGDSRQARPLQLVQPAQARVEVIIPDDFGAAQRVADGLRRDALVLVDLRDCDERLHSRLVDFCSGLTYALDGGLQFVAEGMLLLTPRHVDVSGDEDSHVRLRGFYNRC